MNRKKLHLNNSIKSCLIIIEFLVCIRRHVLKESMLHYLRSALLLITYFIMLYSYLMKGMMMVLMVSVVFGDE